MIEKLRYEALNYNKFSEDEEENNAFDNENIN